MHFLSQDVYRSSEGISRSSLWAISKSPMHFKYLQEHPQQETASLTFGSAAHKWMLERDSFYDEFCVVPKVDRRTTAGQLEWAKFCEERGERTLIEKTDFDVIVEMGKAIEKNELAAQLLTGVCETSWFWEDVQTGVKCKIRPDCLTELDGKKYIIDYKTTDSCEDGHFERSVKKYGYKLQAGMYHEGMFCNTYEDYGFGFVAQEKKPPYACRVYLCDPEFIREGADKFHELLGIYKYCVDHDSWYGYEGVFDVPVVLYADNREREEE